MSRHFMRYVRSVAKVRESGTDADFYRGPGFALLPAAVTKPVRTWCGENLGSLVLGREGLDDDPIEVYVLPLGKDAELAALKEMLGGALAKAVADAAASPPADVFARSSDAFFDTLRVSADLRDFILVVEGNAAACGRDSTVTDPGILIEV